MTTSPRNRYGFPPLSILQDLQPREIGLIILPHLGLRAFEPDGHIRGLADEAYYRTTTDSDEFSATQLLFEGLSYLQRAGYVGEGVSRSPPTRFLIITRTGRAAIEHDPAAYSARTIPAEELLSEAIAKEALPEIDSGPRRFPHAVFAAFKAMEMAVSETCAAIARRDQSGFNADNKLLGVPLMMAAFGLNGPLRDNHAHVAEEEGLQRLFAGALAMFKNPGSHRKVELEDPLQAMRLLALASLLMQLLEERKTLLGL